MKTWALRGNGKGPEKETETKRRPLRKTTRARAGGLRNPEEDWANGWIFWVTEDLLGEVDESFNSQG